MNGSCFWSSRIHDCQEPFGYLSKYLPVLTSKNIFEVRLFDEVIPIHKLSLWCYFNDSFFAVICATRNGA